MGSMLSKEQVNDLLSYIGVTKVRGWRGNTIQFTCPIHGESNPSCGINVDYTPSSEPHKHFQVFHCFSCGAGGNIPKFLLSSLPDEFKTYGEARKFLQDRYNVTFSTTGYSADMSKDIKRYEDFFSTVEEDTRHIIPFSKLAPFKSGKQTYQYFFKRGFDMEDVIKYKIGRDLESETVTIPIFWEDNKLAGIIGRYIDAKRPKNERFKIYSFPKSTVLFPLNYLRVVSDTIIGVESMFDAMILHKWGYPNVVALMGDGMSEQQANKIAKLCSCYISLHDNDKGGMIAYHKALKELKGKAQVLRPTYYPEKGKDPLEWGEVETIKVINSCKEASGSILRFDDT